MTPEQIDLEFEHIKYDNVLKKGEVFEDDEYDSYDEETENVDSMIIDDDDIPMQEAKIDNNLPKSIEKEDTDEWDFVEIDEIESEED